MSKVKSSHGGPRPGAGRKPGSKPSTPPTRVVEQPVPFSSEIDARLRAAVKASGRQINEAIQTCVGRDYPGWND